MTNSPAIESVYVVDTNALIWYLAAPNKLTAVAREIFSAAERGETQLIISAITVAEFYYSNQKWGWFEDFSQIFHELVTKPYFNFVPLQPNDILEFAQDVAVLEMHDRIIAGLARRLKAPLITSDSQIALANVVSIVW